MVPLYESRLLTEGNHGTTILIVLVIGGRDLSLFHAT